MSRYRIPMIMLETIKSIILSQWHVSWLLFYIKDSKCNGANLLNEISFSLRWIHTQTHSHPKSTLHRITDQALLRRKQDELCHEKAMDRGKGEPAPPCWKRGQHVAAALRLQRRRGEQGGGSLTAAAHAGLQSHKQRYDGIWGVLVSLQTEVSHKSGRVLVEKIMFWRFSQH